MPEKTDETNKSRKFRPGSVMITLILSLVSIKGLSLSLPTHDGRSFQRMQPGSFLWIVLFFVLSAGLLLLNTFTVRKMRQTAAGLALIYSLFNIFGYFYKTYGAVISVCSGINDLLNLVSYLIGYGCLAYGFCLFLIWFFRSFSPPVNGCLCRRTCLLFLLVTLLLLVAWSPWFLQLAPGITSPDSDNQIHQVMGDFPLSNNHPVLHTLWIKLLFSLAGTPQNGVMLYSVTQLFLGALAFAVCICFIDSIFRRKWITLAGTLWFAFYPVYPIYGVTMWKDVPFAVFFLLAVLSMCRIIVCCDEARIKPLLIRSVLLFLVLCFLRHNGILVFVPAAAVLFFWLKKYRKFYLGACLSAAAVYLLFQYAAVPLLHISAGRASEGFSIPLQQIARVVRDHGSELSDEQHEILDRYFNTDLGKVYKSTLSNNVKFSFNEKLFAKEPGPLLRLWANVLKAYPWVCLESVLHNSFGFWYPEEPHPAMFFDLFSSGVHGIHEAPLIRSALMDKIQDFLENMKYYSVPVLSWFFSPAAGAWILIFLWNYSRLRNGRFRIALVPLLSLWIQMFGSPAYCEFRYVYGLFTCLPLVLCVSLLPLPEESGDVLWN